MATIAALLNIFGSLRCWKQEDRILYSQDFKTLPAFKTCSLHMKLGPGAFPGFSYWRASANSSEVNSPEMHLSSGVGILQRSDTFLFTSLSDSRSLVLYVPFFTSCDTMELVVMGVWDMDDKGF